MDHKLEKVSVVIPMYNAADTIGRALDSVRNQTLPVYEVIVVNDGSSDQSLAVLQTYITAYPLFPLRIISQENGGVSAARNSGLKQVTGDFIAFLDADDEWFPQKTAKQIEILRNRSSVDFIAASITEPTNGKKGLVSEITLKDQIFKNHFQPSTVLMHKRVYDKVGLFKQDQKYAEEGNYFMRVAKQFTCAVLNERLVSYGFGKSSFGESGLSSNLKEMEKGELMNLRFAYNQKYISALTFVAAIIFSLLKYLRRLILVKMR